ncbi:MAG: signal peptidase I [Eubacteriaceae bacterium]|jgi:signal peptidase I
MEDKQIRAAPEQKKEHGNEPSSDKDIKQKETQPGVLQELLYLIIKIAAVCLAFVLIFTFMFGVYRNSDLSMNPAVKDGDLVFFYRYDKNYVKDDVLVLKYQGEYETRRVIAVAGDEVDIKDGGLYINGSLQQESGIYQTTDRYEEGIDFPVTVDQGQVFVLGDSRRNATDSRIYGCVDINSTLGKVMTIVRRRGI